MSDTIVAPATASGRAGVGIVRVSGPLVIPIAQKLAGKLPPARMAHYAAFKDAHHTIIDKGFMLFFPAPHSFTGEDVLELQLHGSPIIIDMLVQEVIALGARLARPGEFSERAFLNHKMDLAQAEAVADLINASSVQAARAARQSLEGVFSQKINSLNEKLIELRMHVEAALDFPEEDIDFLNAEKLQEKLDSLLKALSDIQSQAKQGVLLQEGMTAVIAGKPNAGKSTLLNQLSGRESAIVTPIAGTTRDILREFIHIDGLPLQVIDTAGLRESQDVIEQEGVRRAREVIQKADCILYIKDITEEGSEEEIEEELAQQSLLEHPRLVVVYNKVDLEEIPPNPPLQKGGNFLSDEKFPLCPLCKEGSLRSRRGISIVKLSAKTGEGIERLKTVLKNIMGYQQTTETTFSARRRHLDALNKVNQFLQEARERISDYQAIEYTAEELRLAHQALGEITGEFTTEALLEEIFSNFCIGK